MPTSRWRSSLSNIEARLRRSLGIAGPIGLELSDPPTLQPVVVSDDVTRPGCSSEFRGRRFTIPVALSITGASFGSYAFRTDAPLGIIIDTLQLSVFVPGGGAFTAAMQVWYDSVAQVAAGLPYATTTRDGQMVDPMNSPTDVPPIFAGSNGGIGGAGQRIWNLHIVANGTPATAPLDLWLPNGAALMIGNTTLAAPLAGLDLFAVFRGRVF